MFNPFDPPEILKRLGFRCIEPTQFALSDGTTVTVQADGWMLKAKALPPTESEAACLRLYRVYYSSGRSESLDESDVIGLVGEAAFRDTD